MTPTHSQAGTNQLSHDEYALKASEQDMWAKGDWAAAILSFLTLHCFLHLLLMRDAARPRSLGWRVLVAAVFYPAYIMAFAVWAATGAVLTVLAPLLFFVGRAAKS